jgi:chemotaxis protein methyltransferase CheR
VSVRDPECTRFLEEALPRLRLRWPGFRKVRGLVCKRLSERIRVLGLANLAAYHDYLETHPTEWATLESFCRIPISRFYRDSAVFEHLKQDVLPALARAAGDEGRSELECWSACCASGEEPYTVSIVWKLRLASRFSSMRLRIVATDIDEQVLARARIGCYKTSSLKAVPAALFDEAFLRRDAEFCIREEFRAVEFLQQDIRTAEPTGAFDLVLCRNAVLTYFARALQEEVITRIGQRLRPGGALVIGIHESLPEGLQGFEPWPGARSVFRIRR